MKRLLFTLGAVVAALLIIGAFGVPVAWPAHAGGGPSKATIAVDSHAGDQVTFAVTVNTDGPGPKFQNPYEAWVKNACYDASGELLTAEYLPVQWTSVPNDGVAGPFTTTGAECRAFVWEFPASEDPVSAVLIYAP